MSTKRFLCVGGPLSGRMGDMPDEWRYMNFPLMPRPVRFSDVAKFAQEMSVDYARYRWHKSALTFPFGRFEAFALVWDEMTTEEADRAALASVVTMSLVAFSDPTPDAGARP